MCAYVCVCVRGTDNNNLVLFSDNTLIWQGFSQPELNSQARLSGLRTLEIYLFLSPLPWDSKPPLRWVLGIELRSLCLQSSILPTDLCSQTPRHLNFKFRILFWSKQEIIGTNIQLSVLFNVCVRSKYLLKIVSSGHWFNPINFSLSDVTLPFSPLHWKLKLKLQLDGLDSKDTLNIPLSQQIKGDIVYNLKNWLEQTIHKQAIETNKGTQHLVTREVQMNAMMV